MKYILGIAHYRGKFFSLVLTEDLIGARISYATVFAWRYNASLSER